MVELGKVKKPEAEAFLGKRKLFCVPNIQPIVDAPNDYNKLVERFWDEVAQQIEKLEALGKTRKIFCEGLLTQGREALDTLERINKKLFEIVKERVNKGAILLSIERDDIFGPFIDWANCLHVVKTREVFEKIFGFYNELHEKRIQHIQNLIDTNLSAGEAGVLILRDDDRVRLQFPNDIEVFLVTPPSYDGILRWFREMAKT